MSRALTVGTRTTTNQRTQTTNRGKNPPSASSSSRGVGTGSCRGRARNSSKIIRKADSSSPKSSPLNKPKRVSGSKTELTPTEPRVVTLADLETKSRSSPTATPSRRSKVTVVKPGKNTRTSKEPPTTTSRKGSAARTGRNKNKKESKMWNNNDDVSSGANNSNSSYQGGSGRLGRNHSNQGQYRGIHASPGSSVTDDSPTPSDGQQKMDDRQGKYNPQGGYTLVVPDPKKHEKIKSQASEELERLESHRQKNRVGHVSIQPSRVGGSQVSQEEVRRQQQKQQESKKYEMIRKRQEWAADKKRREDKEYEEKKVQARQQTLKNKETAQQRQRDLGTERKRWIDNGGLERLGSTDGGPQRAGGAAMASQEDEIEIDPNAVDRLMEMYPLKTPEKLREMLGAANGDIIKVIDWLSN